MKKKKRDKDKKVCRSLKLSIAGRKKRKKKKNI